MPSDSAMDSSCHLEPALQFPANLDCNICFMSTCFERFLEVEMTLCRPRLRFEGCMIG